jgi:hypothetical protein
MSTKQMELIDKENHYQPKLNKKNTHEEISYKKTVLGESTQQHVHEEPSSPLGCKLMERKRQMIQKSCQGFQMKLSY